jgi:glycosyltransferase involved in cell wall biosynthesis
MRVLILTTVHPPLDDRIFYKEAQSLHKKNEVTLIAPSTADSVEDMDGIQIITVRKSKNKLLHPVTLWRVFKTAYHTDSDAYHCHEPSSLMVAILLKLLKNIPIVYDAHEHYPSLIARNSVFPHTLRPVVHFLIDVEERLLIKFADVIITVDSTLAEKYQKHHKKVYIISNYPRIEMFQYNKHPYLKNQVVYVGGISRLRGIFQMIEATRQADVPFLCVGWCDSEIIRQDIKRTLAENEPSNVVFTGRVSYTQAHTYIQSSGIGLSLLQPDFPDLQVTVPIKLFEYMAFEKPVIASDFPVIRSIVKKAQCGIVVDPTDVNAIADAITYLIIHPEEAKLMGEHGRKAVEGQYNWGKMEERLLYIYKDLEEKIMPEPRAEDNE